MIRKLQIGSAKPEGTYREGEWINIDLVRHKPRGHFLVADGCALPFRAGRFVEIHAIHVMEHMPRDLHMPFLREIKRVLAPEGVAMVEVPNFLEVVQLLCDAAFRRDWEEVRIRTVGIYGKGRHNGDFHHWGFVPMYFEDLLEHAGLKGERSFEMISSHHRQEPVLLYRVSHG